MRPRRVLLAVTGVRGRSPLPSFLGLGTVGLSVLLPQKKTLPHKCIFLLYPPDSSSTSVTPLFQVSLAYSEWRAWWALGMRCPSSLLLSHKCPWKGPILTTWNITETLEYVRLPSQRIPAVVFPEGNGRAKARTDTYFSFSCFGGFLYQVHEC